MQYAAQRYNYFSEYAKKCAFFLHDTQLLGLAGRKRCTLRRTNTHLSVLPMCRKSSNFALEFESHRAVVYILYLRRKKR